MSQNGEAEVKDEPMEEETTTERSEDYEKLVEYGIDPKIAIELEVVYGEGLLTPGDLDERALDALKEFPVDGGLSVLKQFKESNLEHVGNKSAYLCGVMKTFRQKNQMRGVVPPAGDISKGPPEVKLKELLDRTGYSLDVTTGQRKYGGPPPDYEGGQPGAGHEVFVGKIPKDTFEDELVPIFENCGKIWDLRLMMDPMTGLNRGYCFVTYCEKVGAQRAVKELNDHELKGGRKLKVNISVANLRLFVGNIPKSKSKDEIMEEFGNLTEGLKDCIIYSSPDDSKKKNRGFCFLEYDNHKSASLAKRRLGSGRIKVWGCDIIVDWADPVEEPDEQTMSKVKVLYVRNLKTDVTDEELKEKFEPYGKIDRVKKIKDYGFVHFEERDDAIKALEELNGQKMGETEMEISLAKPPSEGRQDKKRKREMGGGFDQYWVPPPFPGGRMGPPRGRGMRGARGARGGFRDYGNYDYYSGGYGGGYGDGYGYDDYGYGGYEGGYDDYGYGGGYSPAPRGRGRGGPPPPPGRGRGVGLPRGGRGAAGPRGASRGARGMRGSFVASRGRGGAGGRGGMLRGAKRKMDGGAQGGMPKRRMPDSWGAQPIAQQPLDNSQWYKDSYSGQHWS